MRLPFQFKERRILSSTAASLGLVYPCGFEAIQKWSVSVYDVSLLDRLALPTTTTSLTGSATTSLLVICQREP